MYNLGISAMLLLPVEDLCKVCARTNNTQGIRRVLATLAARWSHEINQTSNWRLLGEIYEGHIYVLGVFKYKNVFIGVEFTGSLKTKYWYKISKNHCVFTYLYVHRIYPSCIPLSRHVNGAD